MITEVLPLNPTVDQIEEVCNKLLEGKNYRPKFLIEFSKPSTVIKGGRYRTVDKIKATTFKTETGSLCYSLGFRSRGWRFEQIDYRNIKSISVPTEEELETKVKTKVISKAVTALKLLHPNAWENIRQEILEDPEKFQEYGNFLKIATPLKYKHTYIINGVEGERTAYKSVLDTWELDKIKEAFENMTDYRCDVSRRNCRIRVECKLGQDGIFRAWYTRELNDPISGKSRGYGGKEFNYLLINPTTAWFYGRD
jgi:hypothetical protein